MFVCCQVEPINILPQVKAYYALKLLHQNIFSQKDIKTKFDNCWVYRGNN
jgi:hypothetical protein